MANYGERVREPVEAMLCTRNRTRTHSRGASTIQPVIAPGRPVPSGERGCGASRRTKSTPPGNNARPAAAHWRGFHATAGLAPLADAKSRADHRYGFGVSVLAGLDSPRAL
jgi:hypothetical protein